MSPKTPPHRPRTVRPLPLGGAALALVGGGLIYRAARRRTPGEAAEAQRVLSIQATPGEVYATWQTPDTLSQAMARLAEVTSLGDGQVRWSLSLPGGRTLDWETEVVESRPGELVRWRSRPGAPVEAGGELRLRPAPPGRGTETTLTLRMAAHGGAALGLAAETALRRFKSLVETGEVPTLDRNPAARPS